MRFRLFTPFAAALLAAAVSAPSIAQPVYAVRPSNRLSVSSPAAATAHTIPPGRSVSRLAVRAATAQRTNTNHMPAPRSSSRDLMFLGAALATKRPSRRKAGKKRDIPMYLDATVHVMRPGDDGKPVTTVIAGDVLVDDTELTDDEIDELTARRVIRPATAEELDRLSSESGAPADGPAAGSAGGSAGGAQLRTGDEE